MIASDHIVVSTEGVAQGRGRVAGAVCTTAAVLFLAFDTSLKVLRLDAAVAGTTSIGYPAESVHWIGLIELACLVLCLVPRTAIFGALLMTGYLGGAVATHVRIASPLLTHTLFPVYVAVLLWAGLYVREPRLRDLVPFRT